MLPLVKTSDLAAAKTGTQSQECRSDRGRESARSELTAQPRAAASAALPFALATWPAAADHYTRGTTMAQVILQDVTKEFDAVQVVKNISLYIKDKEFVVLVGPSGCGKTTTLRMVAGLEEMTSGQITIGDRVVNDLEPKDRDIAMVFQNYALYPHMSVFENIAFGLRRRNVPTPDIRKQVDEAAEILGIKPLLGRKPRQLSGGQRQRVALGRAIVRNPQVFLFDEPLSNLDAKLRVQMRAELKRLHNRLQSTAIYVTHDQVEAMTLGDRVVVMRDGLVQQIGEPMEVYSSPANRFVAGFLGSPAMNFIELIVAEADGGLWLTCPGLRVKSPARYVDDLGPYKGRRVVLGTRPEHLRIAETTDAPDYTIDALVDVVEPLGSEILLDLTAGPNSIVASLDPAVRVKPGESVRLALDPRKLHFFDAATGVALSSRPLAQSLASTLT
jgi:multiple sugar transport system ATP-binding protein